MSTAVKARPTQAQAAAVGRIFLREWVLVAALIFGGCCSNVWTLELLVKSQPKSGNLITFAQFLVVAVEGLFQHLEWRSGSSGFPLGLKKRVIPLKYWIAMVTLFWTVSILNNYALGFRIEMPLHIVFRSLGLFVSMLIGWALFGKSFSQQQVAGVALVSIGVLISTYSSAVAAPSKSNADSAVPATPLSEWIAGLGILSLALILSCFLGQLQQTTYAKYGRAWREGLFYTHFLGLPAFVLFYSDLRQQMAVYNESPLVPVLEPVLGMLGPVENMDMLGGKGGVLGSAIGGVGAIWEDVKVPRLWAYLALNTITQYVCIAGVHRLSSMASAVTLNLILNVRKFVSLVISILVFDNEFTLGHWLGTAAVFLGTAVYSQSGVPKKKTT
ncbi:UAA transporter [Fimicolochytrium jonesii]|uniref:UAA transporter n=1 Tax=Fimicolochytrium jonesii TaxID=1396493 RepID=UPI0022FEE9F5|nr:UAA transporter [Fimicolochytrium jonesii]KAI8825735.1 UAA transporter [Fimicolochytrium jonesii]